MKRFAQAIFFVMALLLASSISYVTYRQLTSKTVSATPRSDAPTRMLAVATVDIERGGKIDPEQLRLAPFLEESQPSGVFTDLKSLAGRIAITRIKATELIMENKLAATSITEGGMAAIVGEAKRAMAVKVDQVIGVAGFLQPGHLVDVLVSIKKPGKQEEEYITKTILQNIEVLSSGQQAEKEDDKDKVRTVDVITLEVTPEEAEKLALAATQGKIQLALRGYADTVAAYTKGETVTTMLRSYSLESPAPALKKVVAAPRVTQKAEPKFYVEIVNGNNAEQVIIK